MPHLQELELTVSSGGSGNLLEGKQWEIFITKHLPYLSIFNFKFNIININRQTGNEKDVLAQFRSPFWLNRNPEWYVSYNIDDLILYTVPRFCSSYDKTFFSLNFTSFNNTSNRKTFYLL